MARDVKVLKLLRTARGILAKGWTTGAMARGSNGVAVPVNSKQAVAFCAVGALRRAEFKLGTKGIAAKARAELRKFIPKSSPYGGSVIDYNDSGNQKKVLDLFDRAIKPAKK